jgi:hypothetical protein
VEHWNGSAWTIAPGIDPAITGSGSGVAALSSTDVWLVGGFSDPSSGRHSNFLRWDGSTWTLVRSPEAGASVSLFSLAFRNRHDGWAAGLLFLQAGGWRAIAEHWDGKQWRRLAIELPPGLNTALGGVAPVGPGRAWTVGNRQAEALGRPLVRRLVAP